MKASEQYTEMEMYITSLQKNICSALENFERKKFISDVWQRPEGGGGQTNIIQNGSVIEKGGVNISSVSGILPDSIATHLQIEKSEFAACGLSLVIHPHSPRVPTVHMNVRYFELENGSNWFGGGIDLTPYYPAEEEFKGFHLKMQKACGNFYQQFKKQCDTYFFIKHRNEMRGIGGVFFDYLKNDQKQYFPLTKSVGDHFLPAYLPIVEKHKNEKFTEADKQFQLIRRGRYVEFNLIYDRGTLFGLQTNGRVESILMSLPAEVQFLYNWSPEPGSQHEKMLAYYQPIDWATKEL